MRTDVMGCASVEVACRRKPPLFQTFALPADDSPALARQGRRLLFSPDTMARQTNPESFICRFRPPLTAALREQSTQQPQPTTATTPHRHAAGSNLVPA